MVLQRQKQHRWRLSNCPLQKNRQTLARICRCRRFDRTGSSETRILKRLEAGLLVTANSKGRLSPIILFVLRNDDFKTVLLRAFGDGKLHAGGFVAGKTWIHANGRRRCEARSAARLGRADHHFMLTDHSALARSARRTRELPARP